MRLSRQRRAATALVAIVMTLIGADPTRAIAQGTKASGESGGSTPSPSG